MESHEICRRPTDRRKVMHILLNTDGVSFQLSFVRFVRFVFLLSKHRWCFSQSSLPPFGQYALHVIREIINTSGVSLQLSFDRFVRFVFFKISARMASVSIRAICGRNIRVPHGNSTFHIQRSTLHIPHPTFHIPNTPPPNIHVFSHLAQPHVHIRHFQRIFATT